MNSLIMKRLAIDVDGVLFNFKKAYFKFCKTDHPSYNFEDAFWKNPPYDFWANLEPLVSAELFQATVAGYEVVFVTNCPHPVARKDSLEEHGFWNPTCKLWCNPPRTNKRDVLEVLKPYAFIDDYQKHIDEAQGLGIHHVLKVDSNDATDAWITFNKLLQGELHG